MSEYHSNIAERDQTLPLSETLPLQTTSEHTPEASAGLAEFVVRSSFAAENNRADNDSIELTEEEKLLFAPLPLSEPIGSANIDLEDLAIHNEKAWQNLLSGGNRAPSIDTTRVPNERSIQNAEDVLQSQNLDREINKILGEHIDSSDLRQVMSEIRSNSLLREELAKFLLNKINNNLNIMPERVIDNRNKRASTRGYASDTMSSRHYATLLALSKLDGSFKPWMDKDDKEYNERGVATLGQHTYAADKLLYSTTTSVRGTVLPE